MCGWQLTGSCCRYCRDGLKPPPFCRATWPPQHTGPYDLRQSCPAKPCTGHQSCLLALGFWQLCGTVCLQGWLKGFTSPSGLHPCLFPHAPHHFFRPSFLSTANFSLPAGISTLYDSSSNKIPTVFPHKLHISSQPPLQLTSCSPPRCHSSSPLTALLPTCSPQPSRQQGPQLMVFPDMETQAGSRTSEEREHCRNKAPFAGDGDPSCRAKQGTAAGKKMERLHHPRPLSPA